MSFELLFSDSASALFNAVIRGGGSAANTLTVNGCFVDSNNGLEHTVLDASKCTYGQWLFRLVSILLYPCSASVVAASTGGLYALIL